MKLQGIEEEKKEKKSKKDKLPKDSEKLMTLNSSDPNWNSHTGAQTLHYAGEDEEGQGNVKYNALDHPLDDDV